MLGMPVFFSRKSYQTPIYCDALNTGFVWQWVCIMYIWSGTYLAVTEILFQNNLYIFKLLIIMLISMSDLLYVISMKAQGTFKILEK